VTSPSWRRAYDAVEHVVGPRADELVRTPGFALGVALARRASSLARSSARGLTTRAWHTVNLPAGSDIHRLRVQIGALDREVRRLSVALDAERRRALAPRNEPSRPTEDSDADSAQPADGSRPGPPRRRAQRPAGT
jgi:hypothetical protein